MDRELQKIILTVIKENRGSISLSTVRDRTTEKYWGSKQASDDQTALILHQLVLLAKEEKILEEDRGVNTSAVYYILLPAGYRVFDPLYKKAWFEFKNNSAPYIGIISLLASIATLWFVYYQASETGRQADLLQQQNSLSVQPFLVLNHGNADATQVVFKNVGNGVAKDIYALKHAEKDGPEIYFITPEGNVGLAIPAGEERNLNLNSQSMLTTNRDQLISIIPCLKNLPLLSDSSGWAAVFYKDLYGNNFASLSRGTQSPYDKAVEFLTLDCKQ